MVVDALIGRLARGRGRDRAAARRKHELRDLRFRDEVVAARRLESPQLAGIEHDHAFRSVDLAQPALKHRCADGVVRDILPFRQIEVLRQEEPARPRPAARNRPAMTAQIQDEHILRLHLPGQRLEGGANARFGGLLIENGAHLDIVLAEERPAHRLQRLADGLGIVHRVAEPPIGLHIIIDAHRQHVKPRLRLVECRR